MQDPLGSSASPLSLDNAKEGEDPPVRKQFVKRKDAAKRSSLCIVPLGKSPTLSATSSSSGNQGLSLTSSNEKVPSQIPSPNEKGILSSSNPVTMSPPGPVGCGTVARANSRTVSPNRPRIRIKGANQQRHKTPPPQFPSIPPSKPVLPPEGTDSSSSSSTSSSSSSSSSSIPATSSSSTVPRPLGKTHSDSDLASRSMNYEESSEHQSLSKTEAQSFSRPKEGASILDVLSYARSSKSPSGKDEDEDQGLAFTPSDPHTESGDLHSDSKEKKKKKTKILGGKKTKKKKEGAKRGRTRGATVSEMTTSKTTICNDSQGAGDLERENSSSEKRSTGGAIGFMQFLDSDDDPGSSRHSDDESAQGGVKAPESVIYFPLPIDPPKKKKEKDKETTDLGETWTVGTFKHFLNEEEHRLRAKKIPEIKAANLSTLTTTLCHPTNTTRKFRRTFLLMYRTFTTPPEFLEALISRFSPSSLGKLTPVREMVVDVISQWQKEYYEEDWERNEPLLKLFTTFLDELSGGFVEQSEFGQVLKKNFEEAEVYHSQRKGAQQAKVRKFQDITSLPVDESVSLGSFNEREIADTLTLYSEFIFKQVRDREYLAWLAKGEKEEFKHLDKVISLFNRVSVWVSSELVTKPKLVDRVVAVEKLVRAALVCYEHKNYCISMAITSGVTNSCVSRMKKTFAAVSPEAHDLIKDLDRKFSHSKNFRDFRNLMDLVAPPCIPYVGMYQKDILFLEDGNPNTIQSLVNWSKRTKMAEAICDMSFCQKGGYHDLDCNEEFLSWFLNKSPSLSEKDLFFWSRRVDPKDAEMVICEFIQGEMDCLARIQELENTIAEMTLEIQDLKNGSEKKEEKIVLPVFSKETLQADLPKPLEILPERKTMTTPRLSKRKRGTQTSHGDPANLPPFQLNKLLSSSHGLPSKWSVDRVCEWAEKEFGEECAGAFEENQILGADLLEMKEKDLRVIVDDEELCGEIAKKVQELLIIEKEGRRKGSGRLSGRESGSESGRESWRGSGSEHESGRGSGSARESGRESGSASESGRESGGAGGEDQQGT